jgi:hypothetical protein
MPPVINATRDTPMKIKALLLLSTFSSMLLGAEPEVAPARLSAADYCHFTDGRYSPGAIIKQGDSIYRCVAAFDEELERYFTWVRIVDAAQSGDEISIFWQ